VFHAIAEAKLGGVDLLQVHKKKHADEYTPPGITEYLQTPVARARWNEIVTFDPYGYDATRYASFS
jgi:ABC-type tungstate transport system permease subunit